MNQVTVCSVQLDNFKTGLARAARVFGEELQRRVDLRLIHLARHRVALIKLDCRGADHIPTAVAGRKRLAAIPRARGGSLASCVADLYRRYRAL